MSAPIDDLLYGGDDSGDEEEMHAAPVAFGGAPLTPGAASGLAAKPLAAPSTLPVGAVASAPLTTGAKPATVATLPTVAAPAGAVHQPAVGATATAPAQLAKPSATPAAAATVAAPTAAQAKQAPGSGQQMLQQMFALLKQMLSPEQYATFYTEMRNGNGNDIKSIVDIIKRTAGDAMFSTLIQKLDLTRSFPSTAAAPANPAVKSEPTAVPGAAPGATPQRTPTPPASASTTVSSATPAAAAAPPRTGSPGVAATSTTPTMQRPNLLVQPPPVNGTVTAPTAAAVPPPAIITAPVASVKSEPKAAAATAATPPAANGTAASPAASAKNEQLEKIEFAKKLLFHASTCTLASGVCQVTKCDDVRRVFKHSVSCGGARSCSHCEQLKGLVKYHAKECLVAASDHCTIPFCDGLRRTYLSSTAAQAAKKTPTGASATAGARAGVTSDDDDDNTPLASAVNKAKKNSAKAKSPKASPTVRPTATSTTPSAAAAKKKTPATTATPAAKPTTTASPAAAAASKPATPATATAAPPAAAAPAKAAVNANMTVEYGRLLQLILHVQKCTASPCPVGEECAEAKTLLRDINSPNAPPRAKTYKQVYSHYKVCLLKKNTDNCPMCKIGLRPILPSDSSPLASPASQSTSAAASTTASSVGTTSPSSGKRSNSTVTPSPRSPSKKQRTGGTSRVKAAAPLPDPAAHGSTSGADQPGLDLTQASIADIRKEADVLTHTSIDLGGERRAMMDSALRRRLTTTTTTEQLACKKEEWLEKDLFNTGKLRSQMQEVGERYGVQLGSRTSEVMAYALNEYLKQVIEEMVEISKQRCDVQARTLEQVQKSEAGSSAKQHAVEVTATDILRVSCEDSFARLRQEDLALRSRLLEDAKREELAEKERAKKRKKVDRSKLQQEEKDEVEMDIEELAVKDLKDRLLQEDKDGVVRVDGRVNESISGKFTRRLDQQVTVEDATYWLQNQKPYISPKLFVRAEAARIVTKSLT